MTDWTLLPQLVVRSAGFPWELTHLLRHEETARGVDAAHEREARARRLAGELTPLRRLTRGEAARLRGLRPLPPSGAFPGEWHARWNEATGALATAREELTAAAERDARREREALAALAADERFLDAVVCSGPGVYRELARHGAGRARLRRQVASYVQRFAAKCETMSFFGPVNYATVDPGQAEEAVFSWQGHLALRERRAYLAAWAFEGLQEAVAGSGDFAAALVPRPKTLREAAAACREPAVRALVAAADGRRTLAGAARRAGLDLPEAVAALGTARSRGVLTHDAEPDATAVDPTRWLAARAGRRPPLPPGLADGLGRVVELLDRYPAAAPGRKAEIQAELAARVPGRAPAAGGRSRFYNDRVIVHEAAAGTLDLTLGGGLAHDLRTAVPAVLDLLGRAAELTREANNRQVAAHLGPGRFPLLAAMRRCAGLPLAADPWLPEVVAGALREADRDAAEVDLRGRLAPPPPARWPLLCSVDVMAVTADLAAYRAGRTPLVLGDIHDAPLLTPWALQFHPDAAGALAERDRLLSRALSGFPAVNVVARRTTGLPPLRLPGLLLELGPVRDPGPRVALDRLFVHSDGRRAGLRSPDHEGELVFHNGELDSALHTALALPRIRPPALPALPRMPRLRWGNLVWARRRLRLPSAELAAWPPASRPAELLGAARALLRTHGVPARFFAKAPHERKPVYVDAACPLLLECLARLARGAAHVDLSEALPGEEQSWLADGSARFAAEFRCVYVGAPREDS
ncbi:lantibiotic dehydratase [Streptomyces hoynatensis]|uniref:Lantibiotic dehydratase n=1 Tax=Streptomyces hoynatensis TaxID=1141874 RepID=A0A3A9Z6V5_9ACTN|nr:lantibiotic dehydratase [Streptomyces hoynatensis]RKN43993.1 lantibiotic dehydratase [Streptomyces hoynatensis]